MTEIATPQAPTGAKEFNISSDQLRWDEYEEHRPPYPDLMWDLIYQHHAKHAGTFETALDVGGGGGLVSKKLLDKFNNVIYSDASSDYVAQATKRFESVAKEGRISLVQRKFDEFSPETDFIHGRPVDLIAAGTCLHFGEARRVMDMMHPLLRSGGTMSAFTYGFRPIVPDNEPLRALLGKMVDKFLHFMDENVVALDDDCIFTFFEARYDNILFRPTDWTDVHRFTSLPNESVLGPWVPRGVSQVLPDVETKTTLPDDTICQEVDYDHLVKFYHNMQPGYDILSMVRDELKELKAMIGDRRVRVVWPLVLVLATKK